jgi:hypothetical protein
LPFLVVDEAVDLDLMHASYAYNAKCACAWCAEGGNVPKATPNNGHSFGFEAPHIPPSRSPWTHRPTRDA